MKAPSRGWGLPGPHSPEEVGWICADWGATHVTECFHIPLPLNIMAMQVIREDVISAAELGADGVVTGLLTREGEIDVQQLSELLFLSRSLVILPSFLYNTAALMSAHHGGQNGCSRATRPPVPVPQPGALQP